MTRTGAQCAHPIHECRAARRAARRVVAERAACSACAALATVLAFLGACSSDRAKPAPASAIARDTARRLLPLDSAQWRVAESRADSPGDASADSLLAGAIALAADDSTAYVLASGGRRLVALSARDGSPRWTLPARRAPILVANGASALVRTPLGNLALLDGPAHEIRIVGAEGRVRERIALPADGEPTRLCAREHGGWVVAGGDPRGRLVALRPDGAFEWTLGLPWADARSLLPLQLQTSLASTPDGATCVAALRLGRGFALVRPSVPPLIAQHPYLETIAIPAVHTIERHDGPNTYTYTLLDDAPAAAADVAVAGRTVAVAFEGATRERDRLVDLFSLDDGRYLGTLLHGTPIVAIAAWETRLYVLHRARGRFALAAYDVPALRDGVSSAASTATLAAAAPRPRGATP